MGSFGKTKRLTGGRKQNRIQQDTTGYKMPGDPCGVTGGAGDKMTKGYEDAVNSRINGELEDFESDLPNDVQSEAKRIFMACCHNAMPVKLAVEQTQNELDELVNKNYKGQRLRGFAKLEFDTHVVTLKVNKFTGGNAQFSAGLGLKKAVCPDPFMGKLSDPDLRR